MGYESATSTGFDSVMGAVAGVIEVADLMLCADGLRPDFPKRNPIEPLLEDELGLLYEGL